MQPPGTFQTYSLGMHMMQHGLPWDFIPAAVFIDNNDAANAVAQSGRIAAFRKWIDKQTPSPEQLVAQIPHLDPLTFMILSNEGDSGLGQRGGEPDDAYWQRRVTWEQQVVRLMYARGNRRFMVGTFPVGTPDITSQSVVDAIKKWYTPWLNSQAIDGQPVTLILDQHSYSPTMTHIYPAAGLLAAQPMVYSRAFHDYYRRREVSMIGRRLDGSTFTYIATYLEQTPTMRTPDLLGPAGITVTPQDWYETRWHWFLWSCGMNPGIQMFGASETQVDEGGVGGEAAHGATTADSLRWNTRFMDISCAPVTIPAGEVYAGTWKSPFRFATKFQGAGLGYGWDGYREDQYVNSGGIPAGSWTRPA